MKLSTYPTPLAIALFAGLFVPAAMAAPTILGATTSAQSPLGDAGTPTTTTLPGYVNSSTFKSSAVGSANAYAFANSSGAYAVNTSATGGGATQSSGSADLFETFTNLSGVAQSYFLTLKIYGGQIGSFLYSGATLVAGESLNATYYAEVKVNGVSKFLSAASITRDMSGITASRQGTVLSGADNLTTDIADGYYSWSTDFYAIDLGVLNPGDSIEVAAHLEGGSFANVGSYDFGGGGGGYGYGCFNEFPVTNTTPNVILEGACFKGTANVFYGDPADIQGTGGFSINAARVPEPASLALAGAALVAAGALARRRRNEGESAEAEQADEQR